MTEETVDTQNVSKAAQTIDQLVDELKKHKAEAKEYQKAQQKGPNVADYCEEQQEDEAPEAQTIDPSIPLEQ